MNKIKYILYRLYYITLMPYLERDKYFEILCNEADEIIKREILKLK